MGPFYLDDNLSKAKYSQPTFTQSVVRLYLNYSGFNPSPGPGLAASERGGSNGSSVLIPFLLVHRIGDPIS